MQPTSSPVPISPASGSPGVATESATLNIEGMTCASCANFVERALTRTPGVERALVNLANEKATVEYHPAQIDRAGLKAAVRRPATR